MPGSGLRPTSLRSCPNHLQAFGGFAGRAVLGRTPWKPLQIGPFVRTPPDEPPTPPQPQRGCVPKPGVAATRLPRDHEPPIHQPHRGCVLPGENPFQRKPPRNAASSIHTPTREPDAQGDEGCGASGEAAPVTSIQGLTPGRRLTPPWQPWMKSGSMPGGGKIGFDPPGDPWQLTSGKRRRCRGRSHEWQPEWVGSSIPGATISQAFED
jgi:hypothetical protein